MRKYLALICVFALCAAAALVLPRSAHADKETLNPITRKYVVIPYGHVPSHQEMTRKGLDMAAETLESMRNQMRSQETVKACRAISR